MADIVKNKVGYGLTNPLQDLYPLPIIASRAPTTGDTRYPLGQMWVYKATGQAYMLANVAANSATWSLLGPGSSDVDTLTGDSGGAISPSGGNITIAGGTNITTAGAANTITANLDAAITLATSVTSPSYTSAANMSIDVLAASNITIGATQTSGTLTMGGTAATGTMTLGSSSGTNIVAIGAGEGATTVNIAGGATAAKAVNIATGAIAGVVTIGTADGASQLDLKTGTGNFTLDGAAASTYTIGASTTSGTISIGGTSQTGTMTIAGGDGAQTLNVANSTGGKTVAIATGAGANAVTIGSTNTTSATTINAGTGGTSIASKLINSRDAITATDAGVAASVETIVTEITTNGDTDLDNVTLADGVDGQVKIFVVVAVGNAGDSVKITPANMIGGTQITFAASPLGLGCHMYFDSGAGGWIVSANNGGTIA